MLPEYQKIQEESPRRRELRNEMLKRYKFSPIMRFLYMYVWKTKPLG